MTAVAEARGLAKHWDGTIGLAAVDFTLTAGTITCLKGRSGSGKSTVLALLAGVARADEGDLRWSDELNEQRRGRWSSVALVPQTLLLLPELSVIENVQLGTAADFPRDGEAMLDDLGLTGLGSRMIDMLSMGQQQRVAVARATIAGAALLLADEPTSHQDRVSAGLVLACLRAEAARGAAVVVASHDADVIVAADEVIDLDR